MKDYYENLYLDHLCEEVNTPRGLRPRYRYAHKWRNFESKLAHGSSLNIAEIFAQNVAMRKLNAPTREIWTWSDQHFGHKNIIDFSNRPYPTLDLMQECLIGNYNDYVAHNDICIWVGDVAFMKDEQANQILDQLNGYKILILGNHDMNRDKFKQLNFDEIHVSMFIELFYENHNYQLMFTHYPFKTIPKPIFNIHGHEHVSFLNTQTPQHINVNCELINYRPTNMLDIMNIIAKRKEHIND